MRRFLYVLLITCFFSISKAYSSGFALYEASVRIAGMMGAYVANGNNVSTVFYNPAGLAQLSGLNVSLGNTFIAPRTTFRGPLPYSLNKTYMDNQTFNVPDFYASYTFMHGLTAAIGVYAPFGLGAKWPSDWVGRGEAINTEVQVIFINPSIAYKLPVPGLDVMVGGGITVTGYSKVKLERAITDLVPEGRFTLSGNQKKPAVGFNLGILIKPVNMISVGFTYRSQVNVKYDGTADFSNLPTSVFPTDVTGSTELKLPANLAVGVNVRPIKKLNVEADYVWYEWSTFKSLDIHFNKTTSLLQDMSIPRNYKNTYQIRVGAEYKDAFLPGLTIRGGISYDESPIPNNTLDPTLPDANRWAFSGGVSYGITKMISVDAFYMFIRVKERKTTTNYDGFYGYYNTYADLYGIGLNIKL